MDLDRVMRRWSNWSVRAAALWAALYGTFLVGRAAGGRPAFGFSCGGWVIGAGLILGALSLAVIGEPGRRALPRRPVTVGLWAGSAAAGIGGFGLLMGLVEIASTGRVTDRHGIADWEGFAHKGVFALGTMLLIGSALSWRRQDGELCARCGLSHPTSSSVAMEYPEPTQAPRRIRQLSYLGCIGLIPYAVLKTLVACGMTIAGFSADTGGGYSGQARWLEEHGIDVTAVFACLGAFLLLSLTHRWGMRFPRWIVGLAGHRVPRWLPLTPAWLGASTLAPYGLAMLVVLPLLATGLIGDSAGNDIAWIALGGGAFGTFGVTLAFATWSYQRRSRPRCVPLTTNAPA